MAKYPDSISTQADGAVVLQTLAERHGETVILTCSDSDSAIRALLESFDDAQDIEIVGAGLEQAFLALTGDQSEQTRDQQEVFA